MNISGQFANISFLVAACGLVSIGALSGCNNSSDLFGLQDAAPTVTAIETNVGPFPGCLSWTSPSPQEIDVSFEFPTGAAKMNIYRDGILYYSSTNASDNVFYDQNALAQGRRYRYTCEAVIDGRAYTGLNALWPATPMNVDAPAFLGIKDVAIALVGPTNGKFNQATVSWKVTSTSAVQIGYYNVYANPGSTVDWSRPPKQANLPYSNYSSVLTTIGDDLNYSFGVQACSFSGVCNPDPANNGGDTSPYEIRNRRTFHDQIAQPKTTGITAVRVENGKVLLTVPWTETNGGIRFRNVYYRKNSFITPVNTSNYNRLPIDVGNYAGGYSAPLTEIEVPNLDELSTWCFVVRDTEYSTGTESTNTANQCIPIGDLTKPLFAETPTLVYGNPADTQVKVKWHGITRETVPSDAPQANLTGASEYIVYMSQKDAQGVLPNACISGTALLPHLSAAPYAPNTEITYLVNGLTERTQYGFCVRAVDSSGNFSDTLAGYAATITTRDVTVPQNFTGVASLSPNLLVTWNYPSPDTDTNYFAIKVYATHGVQPEALTKTIPVNYSDLKNAHTVPGQFQLTPANGGYVDNDSVRVVVDACDNAGATGFADPAATPDSNHDVQLNNCTNTNYYSAPQIAPDHTSPWANFGGLTAVTNAGSDVTNKTVSVNLTWTGAKDGDWTDFAGFKAYHVNSDNTLTLLQNCPCTNNDCAANNDAKRTTCEVKGLDPWRTYNFYVRAYDKVGNLTSELDPPGAGLVKPNYRTDDPWAPNFSSAITITKVDGVGASVSWDTTGTRDDSYLPDQRIDYLVYRYKGLAFPDLSSPQTGGQLITATPTLSGSILEQLKKTGLDPINGIEEGSTYVYMVCARDTKGYTNGQTVPVPGGNIHCDTGNVKVYTVPDTTIPAFVWDTTTANLANPAIRPTDSNSAWNLVWTVSDNASTSAEVMIKVYRSFDATNSITQGTCETNANGTPNLNISSFSPGNTLCTAGVICDGNAFRSGSAQYFNASNTLNPVNVPTSGQITTENGPTGTTGYANYKIIVQDKASPPNSNVKCLSVPFDKAGPKKATNTQWKNTPPYSNASGVITAQWNLDMSDPKIADPGSQTINIYRDAICGNPANLAKTSPSLPKAASNTFDYSVSLPADEGQYFSFEIVTIDKHGNTSVSGCSMPVAIKTTPSALYSDISFSPTIGAPPQLPADNLTQATIKLHLANDDNLPIPNKTMTLKSSRALGQDNISPSADGNQTGSAVSDSNGDILFKVWSPNFGDATFTAYLAGVAFRSISLTYVNYPSQTNSTVTINKATATADGTDQFTITVTLLDQYGNSGAGAPVSGKALELISSQAGDTIFPIQINSDATGTGSFTVKSTTSSKTARTFTIHDITDSITLTKTVSGTFVPGPPDHLDFLVQPRPTPTPFNAGDILVSSLGQPIQVAVRDAKNNIVQQGTGSNDLIDVTLAVPGSAKLSGGSTVTVTCAEGVATFTGLYVDKPNTYQLFAKSQQHPTLMATSTDFVNQVGPAAKIAFVQQPVTTASIPAAGQPMSPAITVALEDVMGNVKIDDNSTQITMSLATKPTPPMGTATLSGTLTQTLVAGIATFADLSTNKVGSYTLSATSGAFTATSSSFTTKPWQLTKIVGTAQPTSAPGANFCSGVFTITARDAYDNDAYPASNFSISLSVAGATGTFRFYAGSDTTCATPLNASSATGTITILTTGTTASFRFKDSAVDSNMTLTGAHTGYTQVDFPGIRVAQRFVFTTPATTSGWVVPGSGTRQIRIKAWGGAGGAGNDLGGGGGYTEAYLSFSGAATLDIIVAGGGGRSNAWTPWIGAGGGRSAIRIAGGVDDILTAGGGGGGGQSAGQIGGQGGGLTAGNAQGNGGSFGGITSGLSGTGGALGSCAAPGVYTANQPGSKYQGGFPPSSSNNDGGYGGGGSSSWMNYAAGGGGGYYGGAGGQNCYSTPGFGAGGGGSSFIHPTYLVSGTDIILQATAGVPPSDTDGDLTQDGSTNVGKSTAGAAGGPGKIVIYY